MIRVELLVSVPYEVGVDPLGKALNGAAAAISAMNRDGITVHHMLVEEDDA